MTAAGFIRMSQARTLAVLAGLFGASLFGPGAMAQPTINIDDVEQNFRTAYQNEQVVLRGWVAAEKRVASQTFRGYHLRDRFGSQILIRTTNPLPDISSEIIVTGVALQDAETKEIYIAETKRAPAVAPPPPPRGPTPQQLSAERERREKEEAARKESEEQLSAERGRREKEEAARLKSEEQLRAEREQHAKEEAARRRHDEAQRNMILTGIGIALVVLIAAGIVLMRRRQTQEGPAGGGDESKAQAGVDDYRTVKVYKTTKVLPGTLVVLENRQETDVIHLSDQSGRGEIEIGRDSPDVTDGIRIKDKTNTVSRRQARLTYSAGERAFNLCNLAGDASNPTVVNGRQMSERESVVLHDGDSLVMGSVEMRFRQKQA